MSLIERGFREKIVLVGVTLPGDEHAWASGPGEEETERHLDELALLVGTAGADVVGRVLQRRDRPGPATYIGGGKAQVELAQLRYRLPRLRGRGHSLSQQAGRIGTRGPGETQLEVDRRRLVRRMHRLESDLREVDRTRDLQRRSRARGRHRELALVGYTNAGKSTLLNLLTDAGALAGNRLFVTLDPRTRQFALPGGETVLVTDTVRFGRKLPPQWGEAFRSTLDSVRLADLLVHVVDGTAAHVETQM